MKRHLLIIVAVIIIFSLCCCLTACGDKTEVNNNEIIYNEPVSFIFENAESVFETCGVMFSSTYYYLSSNTTKQIKDIYARYSYESFDGKPSDVEDI